MEVSHLHTVPTWLIPEVFTLGSWATSVPWSSQIFGTDIVASQWRRWCQCRSCLVTVCVYYGEDHDGFSCEEWKVHPRW